MVNPGKIFHSNFIGWWTFESRPSVFPCIIWLWVLVRLSEAQYRIWEYVNLCVQETDDLFITNQRQILPWRVFPVNCTYSMDFVWLFGYQFLRYVEHLFHCKIFCIFDGMPIVWVILLPWIQMLAMKKTYINIHHITECLSLSFVASFEDCFCLFRTWSFTLCKNDLDSNDKSNFISVYISSSSTINLSVCCVNKAGGCSLTGLHVLTSINSSDFHSWEDQVLSTFHSE